MSKKKPHLKDKFLERMKKISRNEEDFQDYLKKVNENPLKSIRCNTLKISPKELKEKLENKGWKISQPWKDYPEAMVLDSELMPGELGRTFEALLGYYYIQELASMLPIISLNPQKNERVLDLCASPGSKTTQAASHMDNTGFLLANDMKMNRMKILVSNVEICGVTNSAMTCKEGVRFCHGLRDEGFSFDKVLLDAPCSGEGTYRGNPMESKSWNPNRIKSLSKIQKNLFKASFKVLKKGGEMVYSTCTHAPEENEGVVNFALEEFGDEIDLMEVNLPKEINYRKGLNFWEDEKFDERVSKCARIHPQDSDTEGFFVAKFKKIK